MNHTRLSYYVWTSLLVFNGLLFVVLVYKWYIARGQRTHFVTREEVVDLDRLRSLFAVQHGTVNLDKDWYCLVLMDLRPQAAKETLVSLDEILKRLPEESVAAIVISQNDLELTARYARKFEPGILFLSDAQGAVHRFLGAAGCYSATVLLDRTGRVEFAEPGLLSPRDLYLLLSSRVRT